MAAEDQLQLIQRGVGAWNVWRQNDPKLLHPDLSGANLSAALLRHAVLVGADLSGADLSRAYLSWAKLFWANLSGANLSGANLDGAGLTEANFSDANLSASILSVARLDGANLSGANLSGADLGGADLSGADLGGADVTNANLKRATLVGTNLANTDLTGCLIYGMSAWDLHLEGAKQGDLIITREGEPTITVDNIEVGQFIHLLLNNEKVREIIDTITSKVVLILGRFTPERKMVLDQMRAELRKKDYLPVLFDFDKPASKDLTGTVQTLANMARFIIADVTDPSCIPHELATLIPNTVVAVQPILLSGRPEYAMLADWRARTRWVLRTYHYRSPKHLMANLEKRVIAPAEARAARLQGKARKPEPRRTA